MTEDQISLTTQLKSTLNDTITRMVEEINALEFNIFEVEGDVPSANQITGDYLQTLLHLITFQVEVGLQQLPWLRKQRPAFFSTS